jgi:hypothetical protein
MEATASNDLIAAPFQLSKDQRAGVYLNQSKTRHVALAFVTHGSVMIHTTVLPISLDVRDRI